MRFIGFIVPVAALGLAGTGQPPAQVKPWQEVAPLREAYVNVLYAIQLGITDSEGHPSGRFAAHTLAQDRRIVAAQHHWLDMVQSSGESGSVVDDSYFGQVDSYTRLPKVYKVGNTYSAFPLAASDVPMSKRPEFDTRKMIESLRQTAVRPDHPATDLLAQEKSV